MLITLRNSGAEHIHFTPKIDPNLHYKIINEAEHSDHLVDVFLKGDELDSFILDKDLLKIENVHLTKQDNSWSGESMITYQIKIITDKGDYRLHYKTNSGKPDFFKKLFKYIYPDMAEKQIEELV